MSVSGCRGACNCSSLAAACLPPPSASSPLCARCVYLNFPTDTPPSRSAVGNLVRAMGGEGIMKDVLQTRCIKRTCRTWATISYVAQTGQSIDPRIVCCCAKCCVLCAQAVIQQSSCVDGGLGRSVSRCVSSSSVSSPSLSRCSSSSSLASSSSCSSSSTWSSCSSTTTVSSAACAPRPCSKPVCAACLLSRIRQDGSSSGCLHPEAVQRVLDRCDPRRIILSTLGYTPSCMQPVIVFLQLASVLGCGPLIRPCCDTCKNSCGATSGSSSAVDGAVVCNAAMIRSGLPDGCRGPFVACRVSSASSSDTDCPLHEPLCSVAGLAPGCVGPCHAMRVGRSGPCVYTGDVDGITSCPSPTPTTPRSVLQSSSACPDCSQRAKKEKNQGCCVIL